VTGLTSTSLSRAPGPSKNFVRGKSGYVPFWPGGLEDLAADDLSTRGANSKDLKTIPPGFSRGLRFPGELIEDDEISSIDINQTPQSFNDDDEVSLGFG
jgi:antiviral helicase SKI2